MSAPRTNIETQKRRHAGPLVGIGGVLMATAVLLAVFLGWLALNGDAPRDAALQADGTELRLEN